jgi:hypothetical protein
MREVEDMQQYNIVTNVNLEEITLLSGALICHLIMVSERK